MLVWTDSELLLGGTKEVQVIISFLELAKFIRPVKLIIERLPSM